MKLAFVFPGQGSQAIGMGHDLYDNMPVAREVFHAVDAACKTSITDLCFRGPEELLRETQNAQPALYMVSAAALAACREIGLTPAAVAGHSVGEYAALLAAGVFDVVTGANLVLMRGEAMADAATRASGTMAAIIGLDASIVAEVCAATAGVVVIANDNCPGQVVISGETAAVGTAVAVLKERGARRAVPLSVSGAFHSPLMEPAVSVLREVLEASTLREPESPVVSNVTADYARSAEEVRANLAAQVAGRVRWTESIQRLVQDGVDTFIECGPGTVLAGLIKRIAPNVCVYSVGDSASLQAAREAIGA